jgi:signal transduction histidine kinase
MNLIGVYMSKKSRIEELRKEMFDLVMQELKEDPYYKFKLVFALMGVIPLLTFAYLFLRVIPKGAVSFGSISIILYILIAISILAFLSGYGTIKKLLNKIIFYAAEVKRSEQLQADLAASVSHDLEIPIGIIKEAISNVVSGTQGQLNEKQKDRLNSCQETLDNMRRTIKTLLDLYKIEAGLVKLKKEHCDLYSFVEEKMSEFRHLFDKRGIRVTKIKSGDNSRVMIDKDKIGEVVNNIFSNFLKYTPEKGWVEVRVNSSGKFIRMEFSNNSQGIPQDKLGIIFDKFSRLYQNKEGSGLGLAISKDIIEIHGGNIWVENLSNDGVMFVVVLPCA